jgi:hypothetical protein
MVYLPVARESQYAAQAATYICQASFRGLGRRVVMRVAMHWDCLTATVLHITWVYRSLMMAIKEPSSAGLLRTLARAC